MTGRTGPSRRPDGIEPPDDAATRLPMTTAELAFLIRRLHHAPSSPREHLDNARALRAIELAVDELLRAAVAGARDEKFEPGWRQVYSRYSWAQIGIALGTSAQGARQRFARWLS